MRKNLKTQAAAIFRFPLRRKNHDKEEERVDQSAGATPSIDFDLENELTYLTFNKTLITNT